MNLFMDACGCARRARAYGGITGDGISCMIAKPAYVITYLVAGRASGGGVMRLSLLCIIYVIT